MLDLVPDWRGFLSELEADTLPEDIHRHSRTGRPLGSDGLLDELEARLKRTLHPGKPGPKRKHRDGESGDMFSDDSR